MKIKTSKNSKLNKIIDKLQDAINISGLSKLTPVFALKPKPRPVKEKAAKNYISFVYGRGISWFKTKRILHAYTPGEKLPEPMSFEELLTDPRKLAKPYYWTILTSEGLTLRFEEHSVREEKIIHTKDEDIVIPKVIRLMQCKYFFIQDAPIYIRIFYEVIKKTFRKSLIFINERLPLEGFSVGISTKFDSEGARQATLREIAHNTSISDNEEIKNKLDSIIRNNKNSFKERLDELINLTTDTSAPPDYSYCLCCGQRVQKSQKFCNAELVHRKSHKDNCLFTFKYRIKSRLGIKNSQQNKAKREEFYKEMQVLVHRYRISAYERFKTNHPQVFEAKKPGRKPKRKM